MANDWISLVTLPNNTTYDIEAKLVEITANNNTTDGGATYYPWFGNTTSGDLTGKASSALRLYEIITSNTLAGAYLCIGSGSAYGGITLHSTTSYGNIRVSDSVTSVVNYTFPAKSGVVALVSDIGASGKHDDSYFVKAISSVDNEIVRFDSTSGQVLNSGVTISDNYIITIPHSNNLASGVRITGNNIAFSLGIGANDKNHGIYDEKKVIDSTVGAWILWADTANNWSFRGNAENVSGIVTVEHGGTGVNSLTANSILVSGSSTTAAITTREIYTLTAVGNSGWSTEANRTKIPDMNFIAYWDGSFGNSSSSTASNLLYYSGGKFGTMAKETAANYAKLASPAFSGTPTVPTAADGTSTTQAASTAFVMNAFKANDAMLYKGIVDANHELPATHEVGWTYKVAASGTYAGVKCEIGDMIICSTSGTTSNTAHWNVIQTNLDGAVIGPASSTANHIVVFDGETGKLIKGSGVTISTATPTSSAADTTIPTSKAVWAAIDGLDGNLNGTTPGTGKTISGFSLTNGIVSVTFSAISVTKGLISDFPSSMAPTAHTHGYISNTGTLSTSAAIKTNDALVIATTANNKKINYSTILFNTDNTTKVLSLAGTWVDRYSLPTATTNTLGGLKVPYKTSLAAAVTVTNYATTPTIMSRSTAEDRSYGIESDKNGIAFVTVPWETVTASGTSPLTLQATKSDNTITISGSVAAASDTVAGVMKLGADGGAAEYEHTHSNYLTSASTLDATKLSGTIPDDCYTDTNTIPTAYCDTAAGTKAKTAKCTDYVLRSNNWIHIIIKNSNTNTAATLSINSTTARSIRVNGVAPAASGNNLLVSGSYIAYFDGTYYLFRTDGKLPGNISGDATTIEDKSPTTAAPTSASTSATFPTSNAVWNAISGLADGAHEHGNITNDGKVGTGNTILKTVSGSVTSGPAITAAITSLTTASKFLREDGEWSAPSYIANTDKNVEQSKTTTESYRGVLLTTTTYSTTAPTVNTTTGVIYSTTGIVVKPSNNSLYVAGTIYSGGNAVLTTASNVAWSKLTEVPNASSDTAGIIKIGTGSSDALAGSTKYAGSDSAGGAANTVKITAHTNTTNGNKTYYSWFSTSTSGSLSGKAHAAIYLYEKVASNAISQLDLGIGNSSIKGTITLWNTYWANLSVTALSTTRLYALPDASGTIALTDDITITSVTATGTAPLTLTASISSKAVSITGSVSLGTGLTDAAAGNHGHGNIANGGTIAASTSSTIGNGDSLVISTSANNGKITRTKILFDGSTTTKFLSQKGEWTTPTDNDTKNTAGASNSTSKLFLIGTTALSTSALTYSNTYVFSTDGAFSAETLGINAGSTANKVTMQWNATDLSLDFVFA